MTLFLPIPPEGSTAQLCPCRHRKSSRTSSSGSLRGSAGTSTPGWDVTSSQFSSTSWALFINAQAILLVWSDSSQVFSRGQVCSSTKPHPPTQLLRPCGPMKAAGPRFRPRIAVSARLPGWCRSKKQRVRGSNGFIGRERVAAALLIASEAACSSKDSFLDTVRQGTSQSSKKTRKRPASRSEQLLRAETQPTIAGGSTINFKTRFTWEPQTVTMQSTLLPGLTKRFQRDQLLCGTIAPG